MSEVVWNRETCPLCEGKGRFEKKKCTVCEGDGNWEYVADDNYLAMQALIQIDGFVEDHIAKLCNNRLAGVTPDNIVSILNRLQTGLIYKQGDEQKRFNALHKAGATKWRWAWLNANRFAIELAKLNNVDFKQYRYGLSSLVWGWLCSETHVTSK